jgi:hypothetical protein
MKRENSRKDKRGNDEVILYHAAIAEGKDPDYW